MLVPRRFFASSLGFSVSPPEGRITVVTIWYPPMCQDSGTQAPLGPSKSHGPLYHLPSPALLNSMFFTILGLSIKTSLARSALKMAKHGDGTAAYAAIKTLANVTGAPARKKARELRQQLSFTACKGTCGLRSTVSSLQLALPGENEALCEAIIDAIGPDRAPPTFGHLHTLLTTEHHTDPDKLFLRISEFAARHDVSIVDPIPIRAPRILAVGARPTLRGDIDNVQCSACTGFGHCSTECPSPPGLLICTLCGMDNHSSDSCAIRQAHKWKPTQRRPLHTRPRPRDTTKPGRDSTTNVVGAISHPETNQPDSTDQFNF